MSPESGVCLFEQPAPISCQLSCNGNGASHGIPFGHRPCVGSHDEHITRLATNGYNIFAGTKSGKIMTFSYGQEPKTIKVTQKEPKFEEVEHEIGFPCWIRATEGTGGLGSLRLDNLDSYKSWLFINSRIEEFTVSEFLTGRHLANQMLYYNNEYVKGAALECAEYVMANTAPSHVTGNTHFARFINEDRINKFCDDCIKYLCNKLNVPAHGILSFDLKEDKNGNLKVTEVNIRHMAYTGVMTRVGFDLIGDTMTIYEDGNADRIVRDQYHHYDKPYIFLRDVDVEPIVLESEEIFENMKG